MILKMYLKCIDFRQLNKFLVYSLVLIFSCFCLVDSVKKILRLLEIDLATILYILLHLASYEIDS